MLESIREPRDLDRLSPAELVGLSAEIRQFLIREVSLSRGHLGPNMGVVEFTIALHRVFESPRDPIVLDTGHQSYVHKLLTDRSGITGPDSPGHHGTWDLAEGDRRDGHRPEMGRSRLGIHNSSRGRGPHRHNPGGRYTSRRHRHARAAEVRAAGVDTSVDELGLPDRFLDHADRAEILADVGLDAASIADGIEKQLRGVRPLAAGPHPAEEE